MAKYLMSMCLLQLPLLLFLAKNTATKLSQKILNDLEIESITLSPKMKLVSHTPCEVASKQETNSASMVEVAIKVSLTLFQETTPSATMKMYTDVDLQDSTQPAKSALE